MLEPSTCTPKVRAALKDHWLEVKGDDGKPSRVLLIERGEKLCLVGSAALTDLQLSESPVPVSQQSQHMISMELQTFGFGTVLALQNGFNRAFDYRALIKYPSHPPEPASVCSVLAPAFRARALANPCRAQRARRLHSLDSDTPPDCR